MQGLKNVSWDLKKKKRPNLYSGNIPGSINIPYTSLSKNGKFLKKHNLMKNI